MRVAAAEDAAGDDEQLVGDRAGDKLAAVPVPLALPVLGTSGNT